jgi:iron complex outermembrane receptor protein
MTAIPPTRFLMLAAFGLPGVLAAQPGSIAGRVTDSTRAQALSGAQVSVRDAAGRSVATAESGSNGAYRVANLPAGRYTVLFSLIPYAPRAYDGVQVNAGATTTLDATLVPSAYQLAEVTVTTVSRVPEKITEAPAEISVIPAVQVQERPALTVTDHLKNVPGVQVSQGGLIQSNVVARGFNNAFSGALLTLIDNRYAAVPSLRVNVPAFFPATNEDIEQVEFVLGPGAALYGPNASSGVLHIITKSPFNSAGTTLSVEGGARAGSPSAASDNGAGIFRASFRHASVLSPKVGFKVSGEWLKGRDWKFRDPAEPATLPNQPGVPCNTTFGCRDFDLEKWSGEVRLDVKPDENTEWITSYGRTQAGRLIETTGIGAAQAKDWRYQHVQSRFRYRDLFVQGFVNFSNAGESFLLRDGNPIIDESRVWVGQAQHGFRIGSRETVIYGADYIYTDARTGGTINGSNEGDDSIKEIGGYVHSVTRLSPKLDLVAALRVDKHSALESAVWSPRLALVVKPNEVNNLRLTYNRSFSTPSNNNLYLDISAGQLPGTPYGVRALGVPKTGFHFRANGGCTGGIGNLCMRSPFAPQLGLVPARAALLWAVAVGAVAPSLAALPPPLNQLATILPLVPAPTTQVGTQLRVLNLTSRTFIDVGESQVTDIERLKPSITNTFEAGYKATIASKARLSLAGWYERRNNFVGPLIVETPNVFLDRATTIAYLTAAFQAAGLGALAGQAATQVGTAMAGISGSSATGTTGVPLGTVVPNDGNPLTARPDLFLTYRNFGNVDLFGADLALDYVADSHWSLGGTYSWVSDDFFPQAEVGGLSDVALNASRSRGSGTVRYRDDPNGWGGEVRFRYVKGFPVNSGVYVTAPGTTTDTYGVIDAQATWRPPIRTRNMLITATVQNVFNKAYATFVGVPQLGRLFLSKVSYTF